MKIGEKFKIPQEDKYYYKIIGISGIRRKKYKCKLYTKNNVELITVVFPEWILFQFESLEPLSDDDRFELMGY